MPRSSPKAGTLAAIAVVLVAGVGFGVYHLEPNRRASWQAHGAPLALPSQGWDPRFDLLPAQERLLTPQAHRFDAPMGSEQGALTYNAQKFWDMNDKRGGHHTGDDLNGIGGMNTDLGDPVSAAADGRVLYAGEPSAGWGRMIVVAHRVMEEGKEKSLHTMYAHLDTITVPVGAVVARGQTIGTVGTANGYYPAHLHFELRDSNEIDVGAGYSMIRTNRQAAEETLATKRGAPQENLDGSLLKVVREAAQGGK